jgi:hypothetical protein
MGHWWELESKNRCCAMGTGNIWEICYCYIIWNGQKKKEKSLAFSPVSVYHNTLEFPVS